jgi:NADH-quinone oxidoreductase subunit D
MAEMWINMGPQHPMTHGLWNMRVKVDGEVITDSEPVVGYLHRGLEKMFENRTYAQIIPMADRICYGSSFTWSHVYCMAAEKLMGIEVPERAKYIRAMSDELQRIGNHLMWLAAIGTDLGNLTVFLYATRDRELFLDLFTALTGARMTYNYCRIGGVRNDSPENWVRDLERTLDYFEKRLKEYDMIVDQNKLFRMRMQGLGYMSPKDTINAGITGPVLRAAGVKQDLRHNDPYEIYDELDWHMCTHDDCDTWARYRVRMMEMQESVNIVRECLKKMPKEGPIRVKTPRTAPAGTAFARMEDPRGESLIYIVGDGTGKPWRVSIRSPLFVILSAADRLINGYRIADVPSILGMLDVCMGETDR